MIGILAGMGPKATAPFVDKVVQLCQQLYGAKNDLDFPPMMIYSCPTPFYLDRPLDHAAMEVAIVGGTRRLAATGTEFIAIPCNTAHVYYDAIRQSVDIPVLNMVEETLIRLESSCKRVALLATPSTVEAGIYQQGLADRGYDYIADETWQETVNTIIAAIKSPDGLARAQDSWEGLLRQLAQQVDAVILGCTDLNVVANRSPASVTVVDAGHCLAQAVVDSYYSSRRK
ncbi:MAG: amino acid racemase [Negativicutes bacterium]|nr:amino acid racemase [Negativicutes bacterium]